MLPVKDSKVFIFDSVVYVVCDSPSGGPCRHVYKGIDYGTLDYIGNSLGALSMDVPEKVRRYAFRLEQEE